MTVSGDSSFIYNVCAANISRPQCGHITLAQARISRLALQGYITSAMRTYTPAKNTCVLVGIVLGQQVFFMYNSTRGSI